MAKRPLTLVAVMLGAASCSDSTRPELPPGDPVEIAIVEGAGQSVPAGTAAATIGALVTDANGTPVPGVPVTFVWPTADLRFPDTPLRVVNTRSDGVARIEGWIPTARAGTRSIEARLPGRYAGPRFTMTFVLGVPKLIVLGNYSSYWRQTSAVLELGAMVYDANFNPLPGSAIHFTVGSTGGSVSDPDKTTDGEGAAPIRWTLGPALGAYTLTAASGALSTTVTANAISGPPVAIARVSGDGQIVTVGGWIRDSLKARVIDAAGRAVPNAHVSWIPDTGSSTLFCEGVTDSLGTAACARWRLFQVGQLGITADAGVAAIRFSGTALTTPASFTFVSAPDSTTEVRAGAELPDEVIVEARMADGSPAVGFPVSFDAGFGVASDREAFTDAAGRAATRWRTTVAPGRTTLTASLDGIKTLVTPVRTFGPPLFSQLALGRSHSCGAGYAGVAAVFCWGSNSVGQAGGAVGGADALSPLFVTTTLTNGTIAIASLGDHSCARYHSGGLRPTTTLSCWGLGPDGVQTSSTPVPVPLTAYTFPSLDEGLLDGAISLRTDGALHACAQTDRGTVYCTGRNDHGQLGDGTMIDRNGPVVVQAIAGGAGSLVLGESHTCALSATGTLRCWGRNDAGQLGDGSRTDRSTPVPVAGGIAFTQVVAGVAHTCGLASSGSVYCWGSNANGQLGTGSVGGDATMPRAVMGGFGFAAIAVGDHHSCGRLANAVIYCWGRNDHGQLGDGTRTDRAAPTALADYHPK
jgi:alpha-tubulin suppressor-like RCC1 family protein